jgi:hypothetical protein
MIKLLIELICFMDYIKEDKNTLDNTVRFIDSVCKGLEGLKNKFTVLIFECETKNEKPDTILNNWVNETNYILEEKFEKVFEIKYEEKSFQMTLQKWLIKYNDKPDFKLNAIVLFRLFEDMRSTIKAKLSASDSLSYLSLTDSLVTKGKAYNN